MSEINGEDSSYSTILVCVVASKGGERKGLRKYRAIPR